MGEELIIIKCNAAGQETWRYTGEVLQRTITGVLLEAYFNRDDLPFHDLTLKKGDRFVEAYFSDRGYNIFAMFDRDDGGLKGWYCNVTQPAVFGPGVVSYIDLALDLLVYPDGRQLVLDEDEFEELDLQPHLRQEALESLQELQRLFLTPGGVQMDELLQNG